MAAVRAPSASWRPVPVDLRVVGSGPVTAQGVWGLPDTGTRGGCRVGGLMVAVLWAYAGR